MKSVLPICLAAIGLLAGSWDAVVAAVAQPKPSDLVALAGLPHVACSPAHEGGNRQCSSGEYRITLYPDGCSAKGTYGNVYTKDQPVVTLLDAPLSGNAVATLQDKQFVCVTADAAKATGEPLWYYVTAIPVQSVKACANNKLCEDPGNLPINWIKPAVGNTCHLSANGHSYLGDCPSGWVPAAAFGEYSMGL
jgi:hypothetical protein